MDDFVVVSVQLRDLVLQTVDQVFVCGSCSECAVHYFCFLVYILIFCLFVSFFTYLFWTFIKRSCAAQNHRKVARVRGFHWRGRGRENQERSWHPGILEIMKDKTCAAYDHNISTVF